MDNNYKTFRNILHSSKRYEMDCQGYLILTDYRTGEEIIVDLTRIPEDVFEDMYTTRAKYYGEDDEDEEW